MRGTVTSEDLSTFTNMSRSRAPIDPVPLIDPQGVHNAEISSGQKIYFKVHNRSNREVYLAILRLTADFGIEKIYPERATYQRVAANKGIAMQQTITLENPRLTRGREIYKVIASKRPTNFEVLTLANLNSREAGRGGTRARGGSQLEKLFNAMRHDGTRGFRMQADDDTQDQWTTAEFELTINKDRS